MIYIFYIHHGNYDEKVNCYFFYDVLLLKNIAADYITYCYYGISKMLTITISGSSVPILKKLYIYEYDLNSNFQKFIISISFFLHLFLNNMLYSEKITFCFLKHVFQKLTLSLTINSNMCRF